MKNKIFSLSMDGKVHDLENELRNDIAGINDKADLNYSPLAIAVARGHKDVVELLLENGATPNTQDQKGNTPLHYTGEYNFLEIAKLLVQHKADLKIQNNFGNEALWVAVFNVRGNDERYNLVKFLLESGSDPNHKNTSGMSPLGFAEQVEDNKLIEILKGNYN